ncbi:hypothetical protein M5K25_019350 [Dendrobium thyrsiflorum]|uniref:Uncharacterized protein n=1 Tax=Dendrobium thyrsiflorum TaxID=117978 RepID=A0ABD0ULL7_DENTH
MEDLVFHQSTPLLTALAIIITPYGIPTPQRTPTTRTISAILLLKLSTASLLGYTPPAPTPFSGILGVKGKLLWKLRLLSMLIQFRELIWVGK